MVMMMEEAMAVLEEVPEDGDVDRQNNENGPGKVAVEIEQLDGNKERRFTDRHPARPGNPHREAKTLDEREQAVEKGAGRHPADIGRGDLIQFFGQSAEERAFGIEPDPADHALEEGGQIIAGQAVNAQGQR